MKRCYKCNRTFDNHELRFCPYCGSSLQVDRARQAEQDRIAREIEERNRKEKQWNDLVGPYERRVAACMKPINSRLNDSTYPYKFQEPFYISSYYDFKITSQNQLETVKKGLPTLEALAAACSGGSVDYSTFSNMKDVLNKKLAELKDYYSKFRTCYNTLPSIGFVKLLDCFLNGGTYKEEHDVYYNETNDYDIYGKTFTPSKVSRYSIPTADFVKFGLKDDFEYSDRYEGTTVEYFTYKVYKTKTYNLLTIDCGYSGISGAISQLSSYSRTVGDDFMKIYSDLDMFIQKLYIYARGYAFDFERWKREAKIDTTKLTIHSFPSKDQYITGSRQFSHNYYYQKVHYGKPKRTWG